MENQKQETELKLSKSQVQNIINTHIQEEHGLNALNSAASGFVAEGNVGGGTGMITYEFKGGTGTSSRRVRIGSEDYTVGILVQSNFGARKDLNIRGVPIGKHWLCLRSS